MMSNHLPPFPILYQHPTLLKIDYTVWSVHGLKLCLFSFQRDRNGSKEKGFGTWCD